jgi:hypothetical protein
MRDMTGNNAYQIVLRAFKGDMDAVAFFVQLCRVADILDDIEDDDKVVPDGLTSRMVWDCLFSLPENPFYKKWGAQLRPVMANAFLCWEDSNVLAIESDDEAKMTAHILRYAVADVAVFIALLLGGKEWANEYGPALRMSMRDGTFTDYLKETSNGMDAETARS